MSEIREIQLKRTSKPLNDASIASQQLLAGEPLVNASKQFAIVGDGSTTIGQSHVYIATDIPKPVLSTTEFLTPTGSAKINILDYISNLVQPVQVNASSPWCNGPYYSVTGTLSASANGSYSTTFQLVNGFKWSDGTTSNVVISWNIVSTLTSKASNAVLADQATKLATARSIDGVNFDGSSNIIHFGVCNDLDSAVTKNCQISNFSLVNGARISVKFTNNNSSQNPKLKINSTAAKSIVNYDSSALTSWNAGEIIDFIYINDGTNDYYCSNRHSNNSEYSNYLATERSIDGVAFNGGSDVSHYCKAPTSSTSSNAVFELPYIMLVGSDNVPVDGSHIYVKIPVDYYNTSTAYTISVGQGTSYSPNIPILGYTGATNASWKSNEVLDLVYDSSKGTNVGAFLLCKPSIADNNVAGIVKLNATEYDNSATNASSTSVVNMKCHCYTQTSTPPVHRGDLWVNTSTNVLSYCDGTSWKYIATTWVDA